MSVTIIVIFVFTFTVNILALTGQGIIKTKIVYADAGISILVI